jgi:hypothetical protein
VQSAPLASPVAAPSATAPSPVPTSVILHRKQERIEGPGAKVQNWRRQVCNEVRAEGADFGGGNAILDPANARIRPKNGRDAPVGRRGKPAATSKGCRGATLCKFTTYSAGRYDGIPRTCSRLRGKVGESKRADRRRRLLYFYSRSAISRSAAHLETEETPLLLW